ncbi:hypothetical protein GCM10007987_22030 [Aliivibrio fischeri]|nr:hypothetical protein GCM10007987_22030 [Aliivibrio fischeri]
MSEVEHCEAVVQLVKLFIGELSCLSRRGRVAFKVDRKSRKRSHLFEKALIERLGLFYVYRNRISECRHWEVVAQLVRLFIGELSSLLYWELSEKVC